MGLLICSILVLPGHNFLWSSDQDLVVILSFVDNKTGKQRKTLPSDLCSAFSFDPFKGLFAAFYAFIYFFFYS